MPITTCQKVTLISCSVLCVSLFLPKMFLSRGRSETGQHQQLEVGPGFYPPMFHRPSAGGDPEQWGEGPPYRKGPSVEAMAKVTSKGSAKKHNLIADEYELFKLHQKLLETERMMEKIVSAKRVSSAKGSSGKKNSKKSVSRQEEKLLKQLKHITQVMQEGRLDVGSPEMEAEEVPYTTDWEGYDEATFPEYPEGEEVRVDRGCTTVVLKVPQSSLPTAEALAERMEQEEEMEYADRKLNVVHEEEEEEEKREEEGEEVEEEVEEELEEEEEKEEEIEDDEEEEEEVAEKRHLLSSPLRLPAQEGGGQRLGMEVSEEIHRREPGRKHISFSDHRDVFRYPREDHNSVEEDDEENTGVELEMEGYGEGYEDWEEEEEEDEEEGEDDSHVRGGAGEEGDTDEEDPVVEAESLSFSHEESIDPEAEAEEQQSGEYFQWMLEDPLEAEQLVQPDPSLEPGITGLTGLRNRRTT
ncbi:hypothetical protein NHX12_005738 [Muraenolepis orangiensis]|uniref:Resistance to inhibitors of cholinesterase protein 3 N-terminal domain-containing protein n=1 Tax=Muraenolepis orangiensis TaxID=630683 RepID=A0A9Q0DTP3_9TELE|nr:hypothetical protein NHX12_005738 [Muraenolepis orangiensis]